MKLSVAAVVVTYNRKQMLLECLNGLLEQTARLDRIIVIDNASADGTKESLQDAGLLNHRTIEYVRMPENTGGAGGFHEGIKRAHAGGFEWVWIMDDDAEPEPDALRILKQSFRGDRAAAACLTVGRDSIPQYKHRGWFDFYKRDDTIVRYLTPHDVQNSEVAIEFASFVGLAINSVAIGKIGYPNKEMFIHYDDNEYCLRLSAFGPIILATESIVKHKDGAQSERAPASRNLLGRSSQRIPIEKLWISYFGTRNRIWLKRMNTSRSTAMIYSLRWLTRKCVGIFLYDDHKSVRMRFFLNAVLDGLSGRFDNDKPRRLLGS